MPKLSDDDVEELWWYYLRTRSSMSDIARYFNVSLGVISHVINKKGAYKNQKPHGIERHEDVMMVQPRRRKDV